MITLKTFNFFLTCTLFITLNACKEESTDPNSSDPIAAYAQIDFEPSVSNDGLKMLYVHNDLDHDLVGIYMVNFSQQVDSQFISGFVRCPDWSPDTKWVVYNLDNLMYKIKSNGDSLTVLASDGRNLFPKWSNDGNKIAYSNTQCGGAVSCGVWVMNKNGGDKVLIENGANYPDWTDNGNTLIYLKPAMDASGNSIGDSLFQFTLNNNSRNFITVLTGENHKLNYYLNYSAGEIIFCSTSTGGYTYVYKRINNGSIIKLTTTQGWSPNISSAGNKIIYTNRNPGNGRLWIMNRDGSNPQQLTF